MEEFVPLSIFGDESGKTDDKAVEKDISSEEAVDEPIAAAAEEAKSEEKVGEECPLATAESNEEGTGETEVAEGDSADDNADKPDGIDVLLEGQEKLLEKVDALSDLFAERIMRTDYEEKIVDRMHNELQKYKDDMYSQLVRPILLDIIEVRDSIIRMSAAYLAKPEGEQAIPVKTFSDYSYDLQDILEKNSIEVYKSNTGDAYVPLKHKAVKKIVTDDESLHAKVAESLSCGYSYNGRTISSEKITVYYYEKKINENEKSEVIENG